MSAGNTSVVVANGYGDLGISSLTGMPLRAVEADPKYVGFVIGHRGHYITSIKQTTGAWVQIRDAQPEHGRPSCWFEIQGYAHQVEAATQKVVKALVDARIRDLGETPKTVVSAPHAGVLSVGTPTPNTNSIDAFPPLPGHPVPPELPTEEELDEAAEACEQFENEMDRKDPVLQSLERELDAVNDPSYELAYSWAEEADLCSGPRADGSMTEFDHHRMDVIGDIMERDAEVEPILQEQVAKGDVWIPPMQQMSHLPQMPQMPQMYHHMPHQFYQYPGMVYGAAPMQYYGMQYPGVGGW